MCLSSTCARFGEVVDYSAVVEEIDRLQNEFIDQLPGLAWGRSGEVLERIAKELLRKGVAPDLALILLSAWGEVVACPPIPAAVVVARVEDVAGELLGESPA